MVFYTFPFISGMKKAGLQTAAEFLHAVKSE
ncbi:hypothetical protein BAMTA208_12510 [Bacillus amyloliquefaciens TA208]|nr:hypothetical protein BAMTA208_12510 [Bacillus amyloliquefaciens TA208]